MFTRCDRRGDRSARPIAATISSCKHAITSRHSVQVNTCLINGNCYDDGEVNPRNSLQSCDAASDATRWTGVAHTGSTVTASTAGRITTATSSRDTFTGSTTIGSPPTATSASGEFFCCLISLPNNYNSIII